MKEKICRACKKNKDNLHYCWNRITKKFNYICEDCLIKENEEE